MSSRPSSPISRPRSPISRPRTPRTTTFQIRRISTLAAYTEFTLTHQEYDSLIAQHPDAVLSYIDDDDGELITVGSGHELHERVQELLGYPPPPPLPLFDVRAGEGGIEHWRQLLRQKWDFRASQESPLNQVETSQTISETKIDEPARQSSPSPVSEEEDAQRLHRAAAILLSHGIHPNQLSQRQFANFQLQCTSTTPQVLLDGFVTQLKAELSLSKSSSSSYHTPPATNRLPSSEEAELKQQERQDKGKNVEVGQSSSEQPSLQEKPVIDSSMLVASFEAEMNRLLENVLGQVGGRKALSSKAVTSEDDKYEEQEKASTEEMKSNSGADSDGTTGGDVQDYTTNIIDTPAEPTMTEVFNTVMRSITRIAQQAKEHAARTIPQHFAHVDRVHAAESVDTFNKAVQQAVKQFTIQLHTLANDAVVVVQRSQPNLTLPAAAFQRLAQSVGHMALQNAGRLREELSDIGVNTTAEANKAAEEIKRAADEVKKAAQMVGQEFGKTGKVISRFAGGAGKEFGKAFGNGAGLVSGFAGGLVRNLKAQTGKPDYDDLDKEITDEVRREEAAKFVSNVVNGLPFSIGRTDPLDIPYSTNRKPSIDESHKPELSVVSEKLGKTQFTPLAEEMMLSKDMYKKTSVSDVQEEGLPIPELPHPPVHPPMRPHPPHFRLPHPPRLPSPPQSAMFPLSNTMRVDLIDHAVTEALRPGNMATRFSSPPPPPVPPKHTVGNGTGIQHDGTWSGFGQTGGRGPQRAFPNDHKSDRKAVASSSSDYQYGAEFFDFDAFLSAQSDEEAAPNFVSSQDAQILPDTPGVMSDSQASEYMVPQERSNNRPRSGYSYVDPASMTNDREIWRSRWRSPGNYDRDSYQGKRGLRYHQSRIQHGGRREGRYHGRCGRYRRNSITDTRNHRTPEHLHRWKSPERNLYKRHQNEAEPYPRELISNNSWPLDEDYQRRDRVIFDNDYYQRPRSTSPPPPPPHRLTRANVALDNESQTSFRSARLGQDDGHSTTNNLYELPAHQPVSYTNRPLGRRHSSYVLRGAYDSSDSDSEAETAQPVATIGRLATDHASEKEVATNPPPSAVDRFYDEDSERNRASCQEQNEEWIYRQAPGVSFPGLRKVRTTTDGFGRDGELENPWLAPWRRNKTKWTEPDYTSQASAARRFPSLAELNDILDSRDKTTSEVASDVQQNHTSIVDLPVALSSSTDPHIPPYQPLESASLPGAWPSATLIPVLPAMSSSNPFTAIPVNRSPSVTSLQSGVEVSPEDSASQTGLRRAHTISTSSRASSASHSTVRRVNNDDNGYPSRSRSTNTRRPARRVNFQEDTEPSIPGGFPSEGRSESIIETHRPPSPVMGRPRRQPQQEQASLMVDLERRASNEAAKLQAEIEKCEKVLIELGYSEMGVERLRFVSEMVNGVVEDAVEALEDERMAWERYT